MEHADETQEFKGQSYRLVRSEVVVKELTLLVWTSDCADCGEPFEFRTPAKANRFEPNRRCQKCKRPGIRVMA